MKEEWKEINGYNGLYMVSSLGNISSICRQKYLKEERPEYRVLKPHRNGVGYIQTTLHLNGKRSYPLVHRLVAIAFIPNSGASRHINHKNGIKDDNRAENLEWCTQSENQIHAYETGLQVHKKGEDWYSAKLKSSDIPTIRKRLSDGVTAYRISKEYGVSGATIYDIKKGRTWKHI